MKILLKILGGLFVFFIALLVIMKLFFPIFAVSPAFETQEGMIIDAKYVVTQKYFDANSLSEKDLVVYSAIPGQHNGIIVLPYWSDFYEKNKEFVLGKVILKIGKGNQ